MNRLEIKKKLGIRAASLVEEGMLVGLGTGSTASCFIESLIDRCKEGLKISVVSSSFSSLELAKRGRIPIADMDQVSRVDLTIDGADEIDPFDRMIKGGGGALVREKILATSSTTMIVIVDETKLVNQLGKFGLPVEIIPFGCRATISKIQNFGYDGKMRKKEDGSLYITDNGNHIFDIHFPLLFPHPEEVHNQLVNIAGVVETGFFFNIPIQLLVGYSDGNIVFRRQKETHGRNSRTNSAKI